MLEKQGKIMLSRVNDICWTTKIKKPACGYILGSFLFCGSVCSWSRSTVADHCFDYLTVARNGSYPENVFQQAPKLYSDKE